MHEPRHVSIMDLNALTCRWPYGESPYTFCGHVVKRGSVYCEHHHAIAYTSPPPQDRRQVRLKSLARRPA